MARNTKSIQLVLFKTVNRICTSKYDGKYRRAADLYDKARVQQRQDQTGGDTVLDRCARQLENKTYQNAENMAYQNISRVEIQQYCREATFDEFGAQQLNRRLQSFVEERQQSSWKTIQTPTLALFNDHDLQSCEYTKAEDGRHYHPLNLIRMRVLAHMIQALYPSSKRRLLDEGKF